MVKFWSWMLLLGSAGWNTVAQSFEVVGTNELTFTWQDATGPVERYGIFVSRDSTELPLAPEQFVDQNTGMVHGEYGEELVIRIAAYDAFGHRSPLSEPMEVITFSEAGELEDLIYREDFEGYAPGQDPEGWYDSALATGSEERAELFETVELDDGSIALGTWLGRTNAHSQLMISGSESWRGYEFSGDLYVDHSQAQIGVTVYTQDPSAKSFYRLKRKKNGAFVLTLRRNPRIRCTGSREADIALSAKSWYSFRFQVLETVQGTLMRAKVWASNSPETASWPISCVDRDFTFRAGTIGVWAKGDGLKLWDDLEVRSLDPSILP